MFAHRTNGEFSVRENNQIRTEFMLPPLSAQAAKEKLWQAPSLVWAVCTQKVIVEEPLPQLSEVEDFAANALRGFSVDLSLGIPGYSSMSRGSDSELVRTMQITETLFRRSSNSSNSSNSTSPTAPPTASPTGPSGKGNGTSPIAAPTAAPTAAAPTVPPTAGTAEMKQTLTFTMALSEYTGVVQKLAEIGYAILTLIFDTTANPPAFYAECSVVSTASASRRATISVEFTATVSAAKQAAALDAAQGATATAMDNAMTSAKTSLSSMTQAQLDAVD